MSGEEELVDGDASTVVDDDGDVAQGRLHQRSFQILRQRSTVRRSTADVARKLHAAFNDGDLKIER